MSDINEEQKRLYKKAEENDIKLLQDRINKAIEYINVINENTPSSTRKDDVKMILINYEFLLDILKGKE